MREIRFVKAVAAGNDFIIFDRLQMRNTASEIRYAELAKKLCRRKMGVGADGLLVIEHSKRADFKMRIFNPDGTEAEMCGNGARCAALHAARKRIAKNNMAIETAAGDLLAEVKGEAVKVKMPDCRDLRLEFGLNAEGRDYEGNYINTGVPHVVIFVSELADFPVERAGKAIRYHLEFQPEGTNVNFVEMRGRGCLDVRTYERGVEQETSACGSGCVAAGIIATYKREGSPAGEYRVKVSTQSGEALNVYFSVQDKTIGEVYLEGGAKIVYEGGIDVQRFFSGDSYTVCQRQVR